MISRCFDKKAIFDYIGKDYAYCLYIYIDTIKYELDGDDFSVWLQTDEGGRVCAIISEYYKGIQIFSRDNKFIKEELADFLKKKNPPNIFGAKATMVVIRDDFSAYVEEPGIVGKLKEVLIPFNPEVYSARLDELSEIAGVIAEDEGIGKPYGYDSLYKQLRERMENGMGRSYILRDKNSGDIVCHAGTYAETDGVAVIGGVITPPAYRGKGFSKQTLAALCHDLKDEGKEIFSFFYIPPAKRMHYGVGFEDVTDWIKLYKK